MVARSVQETSDAFFRVADTNQDGQVSFEEFQRVRQTHPDLVSWCAVYLIHASNVRWMCRLKVLDELAGGPEAPRQREQASKPVRGPVYAQPQMQQHESKAE